MKNRIVAGLLAIFGGAVGAHKFYLRKPGTGIFYFLCLWFFSMPGFL
ncbi:MAG: TM2 domain-containing protein [Saprospiraceae bacterium]|nr:TM2 domain-containing protein [Saprospiraceae bacterium]